MYETTTVTLVPRAVGLMATRRSDKERLRQERLAREQAAEESAKRRERRIYTGLAEA